MGQPAPERPDRLDELAARWWQAVRNTSYVPLSSASSQVLLVSLLRELDGAATGGAPAETGQGVGEALVEAGFTNPVVMARSLPILASLGPGDERRLAALGGFAQGYAGALQARTRREQESIRQSVLDARNQAVAALKTSEAQFRAVFDNAGAAIAVGDLGGRLTHANPALAAMVARSARDLVGASVFEIFDPRDADALRARLDAQPPRDGGRTTVRFPTPSGVGWAQVSLTTAVGGPGDAPFFVLVGEDITEQHRLQEQLHHQARHDPLTGLPNRLLLSERLHRIASTAGPEETVGLCFIDLDGFKVINDRYGHSYGDQVLRVVADRFGRCAETVVRVGGDEFVAVVVEPHGGVAARITAERVMASLAEPIVVNGRELTVSASVGVVVQPAAGADADALLHAADSALYRAKADGRGRWVQHEPAAEMPS